MLGVAAALGALAGAVEAAPFASWSHNWAFALCVSAAGAYLILSAIGRLGARGGARPVALAAFGGALLAGAVAYANVLVGQPQRVPAAPGQIYRPPHSSSVAIEFPPPGGAGGARSPWPDHVIIIAGGQRTIASAGDEVRAGAFVFSVAPGPIACVDARGPDDAKVTTTQPDGPAFLSPCLTFIGIDGDKPSDAFAIPALHRNVQVDYWPGLPSKDIYVPFLVLRIAEQNGGSLFEGVAVDGRTLRKAGVALTFTLGTYPVVTLSSAPPPLPFWAGLAMLAAGLAGTVASVARARPAK